MKRRLSNSEFESYFWSRIDVKGPEDCWIWKYSRRIFGYGQVERENKSYSAHRIAYQLRFGTISDGLHVLHKCDNPPCCNPAHLFLGTHADNMRDCVAKNRDRKALGSENGRSKLTEQKVKEIREVYSSGKVTTRALGKIYGVNHTQIVQAINRKQWAHVP